MSQVVPALPWNCRDWDSRGSASGTCWDVPSSPSTSWDCRDLDSRGSILWDLLGFPKKSQHFLGLSGLGF